MNIKLCKAKVNVCNTPPIELFIFLTLPIATTFSKKIIESINLISKPKIMCIS